MKNYNEYDYTEIETITAKFEAGEWVTDEELELFNAYKKALLTAIHDKKALFENGVPEVLTDFFAEAEAKYETIRTVVTYDLHKVCEYIHLNNLANNHTGNNPLDVNLAGRVLAGNLSDTELQLIREAFEQSNVKDSIKIVRKLTTPVDKKHWYYSYNNATSYTPVETPCDCTALYNHETHYIYVESECEARWGDSYWISDNCSNSLCALPVIKAFKEFNFEVGKFYKITCTDTIHWGNNKKKYVMDIQESDEETFMEQGFIAFAKR